MSARPSAAQLASDADEREHLAHGHVVDVRRRERDTGRRAARRTCAAARRTRASVAASCAECVAMRSVAPSHARATACSICRSGADHAHRDSRHPPSGASTRRRRAPALRQHPARVLAERRAEARRELDGARVAADLLGCLHQSTLRRPRASIAAATRPLGPAPITIASYFLLTPCPRISSAARRPLAPMMPPPGCVPAPHCQYPLIGVRYLAHSGTGRRKKSWCSASSPWKMLPSLRPVIRSMSTGVSTCLLQDQRLDVGRVARQRLDHRVRRTRRASRRSSRRSGGTARTARRCSSRACPAAPCPGSIIERMTMSMYGLRENSPYLASS